MRSRLALALLVPLALLRAEERPRELPLPPVSLAHLSTGDWTVRLRQVLDARGRTWPEVREDRVVEVRPGREVVLGLRAWSLRPTGLWRTTGREIEPIEGARWDSVLDLSLDATGSPRVESRASDPDPRGGRATTRHELRLRQAWLEDWTGPERSAPATATVWLDLTLSPPVAVALEAELPQREKSGDVVRVRVSEELVGRGGPGRAVEGRPLAEVLRELGIDDD